MSPRPSRREHPLPLPGIARVRIIAADPDTAAQVAEVLAAAFTTTDLSVYDGGTRLYLDVAVPQAPAAE